MSGYNTTSCRSPHHSLPPPSFIRLGAMQPRLSNSIYCSEREGQCCIRSSELLYNTRPRLFPSLAGEYFIRLSTFFYQLDRCTAKILCLLCNCSRIGLFLLPYSYLATFPLYRYFALRRLLILMSPWPTPDISQRAANSGTLGRGGRWCWPPLGHHATQAKTTTA